MLGYAELRSANPLDVEPSPQSETQLLRGFSMDEIWKDIDGFSKYEVSNKGRIRNKQNGKIRKSSSNDRGYLNCNLKNDENIRKTMRVHRIVALAFHGQNDGIRTDVNHIDKDRANNCAENLEWVTRRENCTHGSGNRTVGAYRERNGKWRSAAMIKNTYYRFGTFETEEEAGAAYLRFLDEHGLENKYAKR